MERTELKEFPSFFTGTVPPQWALDFCQTDMEHLRQFHQRFIGVDATNHPPLTGDRLTAQALILARGYPDEHTCRASLWTSAIESLTAEQRHRVQFSNLPEPEPDEFPVSLEV